MIYSLFFILLSSIIPLLIFIGIIYVIVRAFSGRNTSTKITEEEGADMLKNIYTYLVLFATLMMTIGGFVGVFSGIANYVVPDPYIETYTNYESGQSNGSFTNDGTVSPPSDKSIREQYEDMKKDSIEAERRSALKLMIQSIGWIIIPLPIFLYYQKQSKRTTDKVVKDQI